MSKTTDIKFQDWDAFAKANPHFVITKEIPAQTRFEPNYGAIRAVLRAGVKIKGVELVEMSSNPSPEKEPTE